MSSVDTASGTLTVSVAAPGGSKALVIHTTKDTALRRYAPDSVNFDEAKPAPLDSVKPGDQLRARGTRNADGSEFAAEEIVSGSFRNISGTVVSVDAAMGVVSVTDLATKKPVVVKITAQSQDSQASSRDGAGHRGPIERLPLRRRREPPGASGGAQADASPSRWRARRGS